MFIVYCNNSLVGSYEDWCKKLQKVTFQVLSFAYNVMGRVRKDFFHFIHFKKEIGWNK